MKPRIVVGRCRSLLGAMRHPVRGIREFGLRHAWSSTRAVTHNGLTLRFVTPNDLCDYRARTFATKEPETLRWIETMSSDDILWDVGANVGLYSVYAAALGLSHVVAVEPSVFNLQALAMNININEVGHAVTVVPLAVTAASGVAELNLSTTQLGGAHASFGGSRDQHGNPFVPVQSHRTLGLTLDGLVALGLPRPKYLKIDVDGFEHLVLSGGTSTLESLESCLIELTDAYEEQASRARRLLLDAGLQLEQMHDIGVPGMSNQVWRRVPPS